MADGGIGGGFSLFLKDGKPTYTYNYFGSRSRPSPLRTHCRPGPPKIVLKFAYDGGGHGKGATAHAVVNDKVRVRRAPADGPHRVLVRGHVRHGRGQRLAGGRYESPFPFTGTLDRVDLDLAPTSN